MAYKISEIVKEILNSNPVEIIEANRPGCKVKDVCDLLEAEGLLCRDERGRHATPYGFSKGIYEEPRINAAGEEYNQVLYTEEARDMVRAIIFRKYPALDPDRRTAFSRIVTDPFTGAGIIASHKIAEKYPGSVIIMYCAPIYRAYDESADAICRAFDLEPYVNEDGIHGIKIKPGDLEQVIIPRLLNGDRSFIINRENEAHIYTVFYHSAPAEPARPVRGRTVRYGMCAELADDRGETETVFLARKEYSEEVIVHLADGNIVVTTRPITEKDGVQILSPESPLSRALIGCRENTSFTFNGATYIILRVFRSETVNDQTIR